MYLTLEARPEGIDTRAIALHVINAKGIDAGYRCARAVGSKPTVVIRTEARRVLWGPVKLQA